MRVLLNQLFCQCLKLATQTYTCACTERDREHSHVDEICFIKNMENIVTCSPKLKNTQHSTPGKWMKINNNDNAACYQIKSFFKQSPKSGVKHMLMPNAFLLLLLFLMTHL